MSDVSPTWRRLLRRVVGHRGEVLLAEKRGKASYALRHRSSRQRLEAWHDKHAGERCFVIGNGPSLNRTNLSLLRNEFTFGLNRIYLAFEDLGFTTSCLVCTNRHVLEQSGHELAAVPVPKFFSVVGSEHIAAETPDLTLVRPTLHPTFSRDPIRAGVWEGATVTFVALQLAHWLGFRDVILVGVDHSFGAKGAAHQLVTSQGPDSDHFHPEYFGAGYRWQLPDLETSELAYGMAREAFRADGAAVRDATVGGKLTVFPKVALETLFY